MAGNVKTTIGYTRFMNQFFRYLLPVFLLFTFHANAQEIETEIIGHIDILSAPSMYGRGYVKDGRDIAARYVLKKFRDYGLQPVTKDSLYAQFYDFPVNTFPGKMFLSIKGDSLKPGEDFLIDASSSSFEKEDLIVRMINLKKIKDTVKWHETIATFDTNHAYYFKNLDVFCENTGIRKDRFVFDLPMGCYIIPEEKKLTWTVSRETTPATVFYVKDLPRRFKTVSAKVTSLFIP